MDYSSFSELVGKTLVECRVTDDNEQMIFVCEDGSEYKLCHQQDCCEQVIIEDICGDLSDLVGTPILLAEEASSEATPDGAEKYDDEDLWTFYKLRTIKGSVDVRWHGSSNGCYSVTVDFVRVRP